MYNSHLGVDCDDYDSREKFKYNFLYIMRDPVT